MNACNENYLTTLFHVLTRARLLQFGIVGGAGVAVSQDDVKKPVGNDTLSIHEFADSLQDGLEVVLFGLTTHENVEGLINVFLTLRSLLHVLSNRISINMGNFRIKFSMARNGILAFI